MKREPSLLDKATNNHSSSLIIHQIKLGMDNFIYILGNKKSGDGAVIDPGWNASSILANAGMLGLRITKLLLTHHHYDHTNAARALIQHLYKPDVQVCMFHEEIEFSRFECPHLVPLYPDEIISFGPYNFEVIHTPGHTPGGVCFFIEGNLFTGDTLFINDCGRTDLPGGSEVILQKSLKQLVERFPDETIIYPGHDYGPTKKATLGEQKKTNPCLKFD